MRLLRIIETKVGEQVAATRRYSVVLDHQPILFCLPALCRTFASKLN
jgi:hypothetical protein